MAGQQRVLHIFIWPLVLLTLMMSACGGASLPGSMPTGKPESVRSMPTGLPESVRIIINHLSSSPRRPTLTLQENSLVQQLYTAMYELSQTPDNIVCPAVAVEPDYTLTFFQQGKTLVVAHANRSGCGDVAITGESFTRQATAQYWSLLNRAMYAATPPAHPTQLSVLLQRDLVPVGMIRRIPSASTAQRLYNAILTLPSGPVGDEQYPAYWLAFQAGKQTILSAVDLKENRISLDGNDVTRGGWYTMNAQFIALLNMTMGGAPFSPPRPDQLSIEVNARTVQDINVTDPALMQQLYSSMINLPQSAQQQQPACVGDDKINAKGTWYIFKFSQWGIPIFQPSAYEGCHNFVKYTPQKGDVYLQDNVQLWSLIHRASRT